MDIVMAFHDVSGTAHRLVARPTEGKSAYICEHWTLGEDGYSRLSWSFADDPRQAVVKLFLYAEALDAPLVLEEVSR